MGVLQVRWSPCIDQWRASGCCDCVSMAGEEAPEGSGGRRHMDLNLHVGLPPLPPPRVWHTSAASPTLMPNSTGAAPEVPGTGEPEESLAPAAASYSPWNALSAPQEHPVLDPIVYSWLDGNSAGREEYTDAPEPPAPTLVDGHLVARSVRPSRVAAATGVEMVNTSTLGHSTQETATTETEAGAPELRFLRMIRISQQHNIVRPRSANLTQSSFEAARGQNNPDGGDNSSFECNICLEVARQPVVTSCGHLFCWPCLYQWLDDHSPCSECPVCKGEVLRQDIGPIYGRGGEEEWESATNPNLPPRPRANRRESLRQQLEMAMDAGNAREMARLLRQMIQNQNQFWDTRTPTGVEMPSVPAARRRASAGRQRRQVASDGDNAAQVVLAAQQSLSMEQLPTSSTAAARAGEPGSSRQSGRPSESPTIRRTRRPQ